MLPFVCSLLFATLSNAQQACLPCHKDEVERHARTNHARTLRPVAGTEFVDALPDTPIGEARGGFLLSYTKKGTTLEVTAERGADKARGTIEWAFGAGDQGVTPVVRLADRWLEHRISYYTQAKRFDLTLGHTPGASRSPIAAIGIVQPEATIRACFSCHSTMSATDLRVEQPGVSCERCHPGALSHARGLAKAANPTKLTASNQLTLCGTCHRLTPPKGGPAGDPLNIRFQPLRLSKSKCHLKGNLGCVTCHPAHENATRNNAAFYRAKCLTCHPGQQSRGECLPCHMPRSSQAPYLTFTDHFIR